MGGFSGRVVPPTRPSSRGRSPASMRSRPPQPASPRVVNSTGCLDRARITPADVMLAQNEALGRFILRKCVIFRTMLPVRCDISLDHRMFLQWMSLEFTQDESGNDCERESQPTRERLLLAIPLAILGSWGR